MWTQKTTFQAVGYTTPNCVCFILLLSIITVLLFICSLFMIFSVLQLYLPSALKNPRFKRVAYALYRRYRSGTLPYGLAVDTKRTGATQMLETGCRYEANTPTDGILPEGLSGGHG